MHRLIASCFVWMTLSQFIGALKITLKKNQSAFEILTILLNGWHIRCHNTQWYAWNDDAKNNGNCYKIRVRKRVAKRTRNYDFAFYKERKSSFIPGSCANLTKMSEKGVKTLASGHCASWFRLLASVDSRFGSHWSTANRYQIVAWWRLKLTRTATLLPLLKD